LRPNKRLGQHFLSDANILGRIADALDPGAGETVIEVGPGHGSLTEILLARGARVIAIEKDRALAEELRARYAVRSEREDLVVVEGDALSVDWHSLAAHRAPRTAPGFKVIGNIPYNITSPLLEKALTAPLPERIVFLVQLEVPGSRPGVVRSGVTTLGKMLLTGAQGALAVRAPKAHAALQAFRGVMQKLNAGGGT